MTDKILYWSSVAFGLLALLLFIANTGMMSGNRAMQADIGNRQMAIEGAVRLTPLNQQLVQALGEASIKNDNKEVADLLASQGITVKKTEKAAKADESKKKPSEE